MTYRLFFTLFLSLSISLFSCGGGGEGAEDEKTATPEPARSGRSMKMEIKELASPESVTSDGTHYYVSNVGKKLLPSEKDGDGFIMKLDWEGNVVAEKFIEGLDAPKGMVIVSGKLYVADVDKVRIFDVASGATAGEIDFSSKGTSFLNDIAVKSNGELFVSATDINRVYLVKLADGSYEEVITQPTIQKPNGLAYDASEKKLYVTSYPPDPTGTVGVVEMKPKVNSYQTLSDFVGNLDGIALVGNLIVFSDWNRGAILVFDKNSGKVGGFKMPAESIDGPADFYFDEAKGEFWIPGMRESGLYVQTL